MSPRPTLVTQTLRKRSDFLAIAQSGMKWVAPGFVLQVGAPDPALCDGQTLLYGLTASKKIGNAVLRNRARRRLRALARDKLAQHAALDRAYVFVARVKTGEVPYDALCADLEKALKRFKLWRDV